MSFRALRLAFILQDPAPLRTNMPREAAVLDTVIPSCSVENTDTKAQSPTMPPLSPDSST